MLAGMDELPEPPWLDEEERATWFAVTSLVTRLPAALDAQLQRDAGLSHFEYQVMAGLSMALDRTLRMSVLADFVEGSLPRLSQVVSRLERRGMVARRPDPADGRFTLATLTEGGWKTVVATAPGHVAEVRRLVLDPLTKAQQRQLRAIGERIAVAVDPQRPSPATVFSEIEAPPSPS
jgi:DNA-binding MarR family transcriptional regulator